MPMPRRKKEKKYFDLSIDYSKVAVGIYSYRYSPERDFPFRLEDEIDNPGWDKVELFIALNFDISNPFFETFQVFVVDKLEDGIELRPISDRCSIQAEIQDAVMKKVSDDADFRIELETEEIAVILLEDLME